MKSKVVLSVFLIFLSAFSVRSTIDNLLPRPQYIEVIPEKFILDKVKLSTPCHKQVFQSFIEEYNGKLCANAQKQIQVEIVDSIEGVKNNPEESYSLLVDQNNIKITAIHPKGAYWALQTLKQLYKEEDKISYFEGCRIIDYPAFRIRGFMHDTGRSYISIEEIKKQIALLSHYKINTFHWHLTENQGWRLESKLFPILNDSSSYSRMPGKYYTLEEARNLVEFCKLHNVLLIPEIEMPGHSKAFERAFQTDMQSQEGTAILKQLIDEVCETFNVPYIHIGTDETAFTNPQFVPEMVEYIREKGKKVVSWNPGWNYKPGEIDMMQLWSYRGKYMKGIPAIDCRFHYINHYDAFADIIALYNSKILNVDQGDSDHAGSILCLWNDRYIESEQDILIQNNFYPSILALAERSWLGGGYEYFDKNGTKIPKKSNPEFQNLQNFENRLLWHKNHTFKNLPFAYVKQLEVKWRISDPFPNEGNLSASFPPEKTIQNIYSFQGKNYSAKEATGATIYLRHVWGTLVPGFYKNPEPNHTAYAYTYVYSPSEQEVGLWINFQNYSRSESDLPPPQGKWDYKESRIWINSQEILPPVWQSQHTTRSHEIPLTNENFEVRPPVLVQLNKGWNKVLLKLPVGEFTTKEIRLVKWMFTCIFVDPSGTKELDGLIYSPDKKMNL
ncbi:MAG: beta-N-acetylhexosaminidase [Bacteroidales bacterium]|nr:beta-N-acetylhexosaminidase [Bacteroidales bacterium]